MPSTFLSNFYENKLAGSRHRVSIVCRISYIAVTLISIGCFFVLFYIAVSIEEVTIPEFTLREFTPYKSLIL